ncbi:hypothetical protein [Clostridium sp. UBA2485]|uniref:hypothetical protein n=2 Tax=unclassified Clostridium TaxID=2614128 RepID=UPI0025BDDA05|nr:hypothetical protein [Clostridium sp. UBA2485]
MASGKTTMAKKLSDQFNVSWYELDNVVHLRLPSGDVRKSPEERDFEFNKIIDSEKWIIEGVFRQCFKEGFNKADTIILLDTPLFKRKYRIAKRWIRQNLKLEKSNYIPTMKMLFSMYKWSSDFEKSKDNILQMLESYEDKVIILKDNTDLKFS